MLLTELMIKLLDNKILEYQSGKIILSGNNGPHKHKETEARVLSHWISCSSYVYEFTNENRYKDFALELSKALLRNELRPYGKTFYHREIQNKDKCNGLIGQAWSLEALINLYRITKNEKYIKEGLELYFLHEFDYDQGLWNICEISGEDLGLDLTFNHQLWFAAVASELNNYSNSVKIKKHLDRFMKMLQYNCSIFDGLVVHPIERNTKLNTKSLSFKKEQIKKMIGQILRRHNLLPTRFQTEKKNITFYLKNSEFSIGYQAFNLYAYAILKKTYPKHLFWGSKKFVRAVNILTDLKFKEKLKSNNFSYSYNNPAFEIPYILSVFKPNSLNDNISEIKEHFDLFCRDFFQIETLKIHSSPDDITLEARIYELGRSPFELLNIISI